MADGSPNRNCDHNPGPSKPTLNWSQVYYDLEKKTAAKTAHKSCSVSKKEENRGRNRWCNVMPFDKHRVVLREKSNSYINASTVRVSETNSSYIVTQGPLEDTLEDFWTMIIQQDVSVIVMLCRTLENGIEKCHRYWPEPDEKPLQFDDFSVRSDQVAKYEGYQRRRFIISSNAEECPRKVDQFHYYTWPDFGVPDNPRRFLDFVDEVRTWKAKKTEEDDNLTTGKGPFLVHCSAGIGRSGAFCLIETCCTIMERDLTKKLSLKEILELLVQMRHYRSGLIQTWQQLRFAYLAIMEISRRKRALETKEKSINEVADDENEINGTEEQDGSPEKKRIKNS